MSMKIASVFVLPGAPTVLPDKNCAGGGNVMTKTKSVAIVAPQRSNSLDYLNFEEKRQLIASSLSLSDFINVGNADLKTGVATVIVGKCGAGDGDGCADDCREKGVRCPYHWERPCGISSVMQCRFACLASSRTRDGC